ncbi:hypothetical protein LQZ19_15355 [Treponema primitia]|uniref:hypothetical protein n=1 Tax=Treponema primitia TaxID=88058 RepID=UPI0039815352
MVRLAVALGVEVRDLFSSESPVAADIKGIVDKLTVDMASLVNSSLELMSKISDKESNPQGKKR